MKKILAIAAIIALGTTGVFAQYGNRPGNPGPRPAVERGRVYSINDKQREVRQKIEFGAAKGFLSNREAKRLFKDLNRIEDREQHLRMRGRLGAVETREIMRDLQILDSKVPFDLPNDRRGGRGWAKY